ncbi:MAG: replication initiator protein [Microviridae sp.]|nr:MAG: replication initiator protein [Microviridae sp.]
MCLYPRIIKNKKFQYTQKNGGVIPTVNDVRTTLVPLGCGKCIECRKKYGRAWQVRLLEDIKANRNGKFITLTFSDKSIQELNEAIIIKKNKETGEKYKIKISNIYGYSKDNAIATVGMRRFLERWRKKYKKSLRHWTVTELGHSGTENIHLHGVVWTNESFDEIRKIWQYGFVWPRPEEEKVNYVNERTVNYIIKYVTKTDKDHKNYRSIVLTTPGIGVSYINSYSMRKNQYIAKKTDETYLTESGHKICLPTYYRNKLYTEEQKEKLWIEKLNKGIIYVRGERVDISKDTKNYHKLLKWYQMENKELGYGDDETWKEKENEEARRHMMQMKRINKNKI